MPIVVYTGQGLDAEQCGRLDTGSTRFVTKGITAESVVLGLIGALAPVGGDDGR